MNSLLSQIERVPTSALALYPGNPRIGNVPVIASSLTENAQFAPIVVQRSTGYVLAGNHTLKAAQLLGWEAIDVVYVDVDDDRARRIVLAANRTAERGTYDGDALVELLSYLDDDYAGTGWTEEDVTALLAPDPEPDKGGDGSGGGPAPTLADRFVIPPFDVLDARSGWWRDRKRQWLSLGMRSEAGRGSRLSYDSTTTDIDYYRFKEATEARLGRTLSHAEYKAEHYVPGNVADEAEGTSVFDPVLSELVYRWFSGPDDRVIDPFAGGSVRGVVASVLGRRYLGNDLSVEQIEANRGQAARLIADGKLGTAPEWSIGDSTAWVDTLEPASADLIFTCPPYLWLEEYSDTPGELSKMDRAAFAAAYSTIIAGSVRALRPDRFAVIVIGDVRDKTGRNSALIDARGMTVEAAEAAGLRLLSAAVLIRVAGSLAMRVARQFVGSRLLGRSYEHVLVFTKGDRANAASRCGPVETGDLTALTEGEPDA